MDLLVALDPLAKERRQIMMKSGVFSNDDSPSIIFIET